MVASTWAHIWAHLLLLHAFLNMWSNLLTPILEDTFSWTRVPTPHMHRPQPSRDHFSSSEICGGFQSQLGWRNKINCRLQGVDVISV